MRARSGRSYEGVGAILKVLVGRRGDIGPDAGQVWGVDMRGGDVDTFTALFEACFEPVLKYAQRRTDPQNAHDVASEVFLVAWRRLAEVPDPPLPWLIGAARRVLANQHRSEARQSALRLRLRSQRPAPSASIADHVEVVDRWAAALESLSWDDQEVLALVAWDGLSVGEAAGSLGCSRSAFAMRLSRARRRLANALREPGVDVEVPATVAHEVGVNK